MLFSLYKPSLCTQVEKDGGGGVIFFYINKKENDKNASRAEDRLFVCSPIHIVLSFAAAVLDVNDANFYFL